MINKSQFYIKNNLANLTKILSKNNLSNKSFFKTNKNFFVERATIENKIKTRINCENLEVADISGNCGTSFSIKIKSADFNGKSMIMQHRMINEVLKDELKEIHALQIKSEASK